MLSVTLTALFLRDPDLLAGGCCRKEKHFPAFMVNLFAFPCAGLCSDDSLSSGK